MSVPTLRIGSLFLIVPLLSCACFQFGGRALAGLSSAPADEEIAIQELAFAPESYTQGDDVKVLLKGELPDPCYELTRASITRTEAGALLLRQFARRQESAACSTGDLLGQVPFAREISLGRLASGEYLLTTSPFEDAAAPARMRVRALPSPYRPEQLPARVLSVAVPETTNEGQTVVASLSGWLRSPCGRLIWPPAVKRDGQALVVQPLERSPGHCAEAPRPFEMDLNLGVLPPGEYLLQIKTEEGESILKSFSVLATRAQVPVSRSSEPGRYRNRRREEFPSPVPPFQKYASLLLR